MFIESNHDLRAARILLGRLNGKMDRPGTTPPEAPVARDGTGSSPAPPRRI
jgi:hypothetical protein